MYNAQYSVRTRYEDDGPGTNPEELIAAAHAACFTMALAGQLEAAARNSESIRTKATVTLENIDDEFSILSVHLAFNSYPCRAACAGLAT